MKAARGNPGGLFVARPGSPNRQWRSTKAIEARPHFLYYRLNTRLQEDSPMRLDDLFRNLGYLAATIGSQVRDCAFQGVPLEELDLTGPPPHEISLLGPARLELSEGEVFRIDVQSELGAEPVLFGLDAERLAVSGGDRETIVRVTLPAPRRLAVAGSGRMTVPKLA